MNGGETVIRARGLTRRFGAVAAVNNVDLTVEKSRVYGFLGPNGSGKSTTIRMLCGLLTPSAGDIEVLGLKIPAQAETLKRRIGYMTQKFSLFEDLSVRENLEFMAAVQELSRRGTKTRVDELLHDYHLTELQTQLAGTMSGGQRQRLALAAAIVHKPELLFLDEAERCHRLAILDRGVLVADGTPDELGGALQNRTLRAASTQPRRAAKILKDFDGVISVVQIGNELRVLTLDGFNRLAELQNALRDMDAQATIEHAAPTLEDVFVAATGAVRLRHQYGCAQSADGGRRTT